MLKNKFYYSYEIQRELGYNNTKFKRLITVIKKRHPYQKWIKYEYAKNGQVNLIINAECKRWLDEVYFNKSKFYLDLEIDFFERRIKELEMQLKLPHKEKIYKDMSIPEIMLMNNKTRDSVDVAIHKMTKKLGSNVKYKKDGVVKIKSYGVKWLYEKYFRHKYLTELEREKIRLDYLYD